MVVFWSRPLDHSTEGFQRWKFLTTHCWEEKAAGEWSMEILDTTSQQKDNSESGLPSYTFTTIQYHKKYTKYQIMQFVSRALGYFLIIWPCQEKLRSLVDPGQVMWSGKTMVCFLSCPQGNWVFFSALWHLREHIAQQSCQLMVVTSLRNTEVSHLTRCHRTTLVQDNTQLSHPFIAKPTESNY